MTYTAASHQVAIKTLWLHFLNHKPCWWTASPGIGSGWLHWPCTSACPGRRRKAQQAPRGGWTASRSDGTTRGSGACSRTWGWEPAGSGEKWNRRRTGESLRSVLCYMIFVRRRFDHIIKSLNQLSAVPVLNLPVWSGLLTWPLLKLCSYFRIIYWNKWVLLKQFYNKVSLCFIVFRRCISYGYENLSSAEQINKGLPDVRSTDRHYKMWLKTSVWFVSVFTTKHFLGFTLALISCLSPGWGAIFWCHMF